MGGPAINDALNASLRVAPLAAAEPNPASLHEQLSRSSDLSGNEWRIIGLTSVGHFLCHASELVFAGMLVALIKEFKLQPDQATLVGLFGYIVMGVGAVPVGLWTDRWSARGVLTVYYFWLAAAALAVSLAPTTWMLALALTSLGAALSLYHPAGLALIAHGCRARGRAMGINGIAGSLGVATGPAVGLYMVGEWRVIYLVFAALAFCAGLGMVFLRIDESAADSVQPQPQGNGVVETANTNRRAMVLLLAAMMLGGLNYRCLMTALPSYLEGKGEMAALLSFLGSKEQVLAFLVFTILAIGGVGQYVGGHIADKVRPAALYVVLIAAMVPLAVLMAQGSEAVIVGSAAVLAIFMFGQQPVENTIMARVTAPRYRSTMYGLKFLFTFGVGALGAQVVGLVWEGTGSLAPVFLVFASSAALMAVLAGWFRLSRLGSV